MTRYRFLGDGEFFDHSHPGKHQDAADQYQSHTETDPKSGCSPANLEAEHGSQWYADYPIAEQMHQHGGSRVPSAAQCSRDDYLKAVKQLEHSGHNEQHARRVDHQ